MVHLYRKAVLLLAVLSCSAGSVTRRPFDENACDASFMEDRNPSNTVTVSSNMNEYLCIPVEMAEQEDPVQLLPREFFFVNISSVFTDRDILEVEFEGGKNLSDPCVDRANGIVRFSINKTVVMSLENQQLYLIIGEDRRTIRIQFYPTGISLVGLRPVPTSYTIHQLPNYISFFLAISLTSSTSNTVCRVEGDQYSTVTELDLKNPRNDLSCKSFEQQTLIVEADLALEGVEGVEQAEEDLFGNKEEVVVILTPGDCEDPSNRVSAVPITISRFSPVSVTMPGSTSTPSSPTTSTTGPGGGRGLTDGVLVAVVVVPIVGVATVVAVIVVAIYLCVKRPEWFEKIRRRRRQNDPEQTEMHHIQQADREEQLSQPAREEMDNAELVYVLNFWSDGEKLQEMLTDSHLGRIPESARNDSHQLTALIERQNCHTFYLIHSENREQLRVKHPVAWELLRDFTMRPFPPEVLQKFIDVRVCYDENESTEEVLGPILTINLLMKKWQGRMQECANWIQTRVRTNRNLLDEPFASSQTPSPPKPELLPVEQIDTSVPLHQTPPVPGHPSSTPEHPHTEQSPPSQSSQQPLPQQLPPPYGDQQLEAVGTLKSILDELKILNKTEERVATATEKTAGNTHEMKSTHEDTKALAEEIHEKVTSPQEDTHEGT